MSGTDICIPKEEKDDGGANAGAAGSAAALKTKATGGASVKVKGKSAGAAAAKKDVVTTKKGGSSGDKPTTGASKAASKARSRKTKMAGFDYDRVMEWVEEFKFTRPKHHSTRDFSDGVLVAELISQVIPKLVELHNYPKANSLAKKMINWELLNRKVLTKLNLELPKAEMKELAENVHGVAEQLIWDIHEKAKGIPAGGLPRPPPRVPAKPTPKVPLDHTNNNTLSLDDPLYAQIHTENGHGLSLGFRCPDSSDGSSGNADKTVEFPAYEAKLHELEVLHGVVNAYDRKVKAIAKKTGVQEELLLKQRDQIRTLCNKIEEIRAAGSSTQ